LCASINATRQVMRYSTDAGFTNIPITEIIVCVLLSGTLSQRAFFQQIELFWK